jgi:hypothetical protein
MDNHAHVRVAPCHCMHRSWGGVCVCVCVWWVAKGPAWVVQIADFGRAVFHPQAPTYVDEDRSELPVRWASVEVLEDGIYSAASDMWCVRALRAGARTSHRVLTGWCACACVCLQELWGGSV